jgi:hypothetical protein
MKFNITARDIKFFVLGLFAVFIFVSIYDWEDSAKAFKEGFSKKEQVINKSDINELKK